MTPVGVFFICQNEDKCHFVNSTNMRRVKPESAFVLPPVRCAGLRIGNTQTGIPPL